MANQVTTSRKRPLLTRIKGWVMRRMGCTCGAAGNGIAVQVDGMSASAAHWIASEESTLNAAARVDHAADAARAVH